MSDDPRAPETQGELDSLGAAPTRPVGGKAGRGGEKTPRRRVRRSSGGGRPLAVVALVVAAAVGLALVPMVVSSLQKTPRNMVGISYGGGPVEAAHFQRIIEPGSGLFFNGIGDSLYLYPADTQNYIVSKDPDQGAVKAVDSIVAPTLDRVQVEYQVAVYFKLNVDRLRDFHEQLGLQYGAYESAGWNKLIQDTFRQQMENALQEDTRRYAVADLFGNADDLVAIQQGVEQKLSQRLTGALGDNFFCGPAYRPGGECSPPTFIIKKIELPDDVVRAFEASRTSEISITQRENEAKAIEALSEGLAKGGSNYVLLKAIESGKIGFWVLPSEGGLTLQTPPTGETSTDTTTTTTPGGG